MDSMSLNLQQANQAVQQRLSGKPWLVAIGQGEEGGKPCIFVYVTKGAIVDVADLKKIALGNEVVVKVSGFFRPATK